MVVAVAALVAFAVMPFLGGGFQAPRIVVFIAPAAAALLARHRPWRWTEAQWHAVSAWRPTRAQRGCLYVGLFACLAWITLARFRAGNINAIDFTVYFDRPCYQTVHGRPLYVESADNPAFSWRSQLAVHSTWIMFAACAPYAVYPSPMWLLMLSAIAVVAGAAYTSLALETIGMPAIVAAAAAVAFALNDSTARAMNYGFHVEILYAWFVPWAIAAGLRRRWREYAAAVLCLLLVKEDAVLPALAAGAAVVIVRSHGLSRLARALCIGVPVGLGLVNLAVYYKVVVPRLVAGGMPTYAGFWMAYGPTPAAAAVGMMQRPWRVAADVVTSGFAEHVLTRFGFLPLLAWRWLLPIVPIVALYAASSNEQLRMFGIYYSIVLVPFLSIGAASGAQAVGRRLATGAAAPAISAALLLLATIPASSYAVSAWRPETAAVARVVRGIDPARMLLVQSALYPHAGYGSRVQLLTPASLREASETDAVILRAPAMSAFPFAPDDPALQRLRCVDSSARGVRLCRAGDN